MSKYLLAAMAGYWAGMYRRQLFRRLCRPSMKKRMYRMIKMI